MRNERNSPQEQIGTPKRGKKEELSTQLPFILRLPVCWRLIYYYYYSSGDTSMFISIYIYIYVGVSLKKKKSSPTLLVLLLLQEAFFRHTLVQTKKM